MKSSNHLYILHKLPTPYNDVFFRALHADPDIQLQVFHLWRGSARRPWQSELGTGYPNYYMRPKFGVDWHSLRLAWHNRESLFMVGDWAHLPTVALIIARIIRRFPVAIWADTPQEHLKRSFWRRAPRRIFLRWLLSSVDVVFGSGQPAQRALTAMGAPPDKIVDLQFTVDLERPVRMWHDAAIIEQTEILRQSVGCTNGGVVFGMSGTIDLAKKAQDVGLRAFAQCVAAFKMPLGLLVAGTGKDLPHLQALAAEFGITQRVNFLGWQEPTGMDLFYNAIDVLLHPAHYDPFPLVVVEAMSWAKPVVGTMTSGSVEEKVRDGVNGFAVPPGDVDQIAAAMGQLIVDIPLRQSASLAARQTAEQWPIEKLVDIVKHQVRLLIGS